LKHHAVHSTPHGSGANTLNKVSLAGVLISLGIIYGDIGTSPLYVFKAIVNIHTIESTLVLGGLSCVFWTLTLQTTLKYIILTLRADNKGEGGIFSLFALVRRKGNILWIPAIIPAIIGGAALLADGIITPPISVSSAVEGLRIYNPEIPTVSIVLVILTILFTMQQIGTESVGKTFGPIMIVWFGMLAVLGGISLSTYPEVLKAINPIYAYDLLVLYPHGFYILGAVFLCTTGAEALYSDMGHCGRKNIRISWIFVKTCLLINYFGQGAWLMSLEGQKLGDLNPFFAIMPSWFVIIGVIIATTAAIIASQALITGSFTLINEAMKLDLWPKMQVNYPTEERGQMYIPGLNWLLWFGCCFVVLYFRESAAMEAAYGLAITLTMLMTTILLGKYLVFKRWPAILIGLFLSVYLSIELSFLFANLTKFLHGGWVSLFVGGMLAFVMFVWFRTRKIKNRFTEYVPIKTYLSMLQELSKDNSVPKYATHLVYLTSSPTINLLDRKIIYSILQKQPKRADVYWFIHVEVTDDPYGKAYRVHHMANNDVIRIDYYLGFRVHQQINILFRKVVEDLVKNGEVDITSRYESLKSNSIAGDFRFVVLEKYLSEETKLSFFDRFLLKSYFVLRKLSLSEERGFGLDNSYVTVEKVPLTVSATEVTDLVRLS
jgi:KUP system potassium uptake protein